jgi:hypothetical protein
MKKFYLIISNEGVDTVEIPVSNNYQVAAEAMLIPYGNHPHKNGVQRFTREHAETMVSNFNSILGKLGRLFGGLPVYIGHPDDSAFTQHTDSKSYAWIMSMEARDDGLALTPKWSQPGEQIVANGHYKWFSPRWACKEIGRENGKAILAPIRLISIGLTNMPQIQGIPPLANEEASEGASQADAGTAAAEPKKAAEGLLNRLMALLGLADPCTEDDVIAKITAMQAAIGEAATQANEARQALESQTIVYQAERGARIELLVSNAISAGIITAADKDRWTIALRQDFAGKTVELANTKPSLNITPMTRDIGGRKLATQNAREKVLTLVNERMERNGEDYETAFAAVRKENQGLFESMKQPANPAK